MFLKFICKAFFAKNIVKTGRNSRINGWNCISALFAGHSTTFRQNRRPFPGKPGSAAATNTAGKNGLLRGQNKAERNCRYTQDIQRIKSRSCRTKNEPPRFLSGIPYGLANGGLPRTERQPAGLIARPAEQGRAVRPAHTPQIKKETPPDKLEEFLFYAGGGGRTHTCY